MEQKQPTSFNDNEWDAVVDKLNFENARIISRPWAADEDITEYTLYSIPTAAQLMTNEAAQNQHYSDEQSSPREMG